MKKFLLTSALLLAALMPLGASARPLYGDVNGDGEVNIADVNSVIDLILTGKVSSAGDINGDGEVNIADINAIIDIILK
jgi:hypothetical protein